MGREIRRVPRDWEHPRDARGEYQPMYDKDFATAYAEYEKEYDEWRTTVPRPTLTYILKDAYLWSDLIDEDEDEDEDEDTGGSGKGGEGENYEDYEQHESSSHRSPVDRALSAMRRET